MSSKIATLYPKPMGSPGRLLRAGERAASRLTGVAEPTRDVSLGRDQTFEILFSRNPQPMYVFDRETLQFLEVNDAAVRQYGYPREELLAMRVTHIRPAADIPRLRQAIRRVDNSVVAQGQWRHQRKNGELIDVEVTTQGIWFEGRDAVLTVAHDVSFQRASEAKVAENAAYLEALMDNTPLATAVLDLQHRVHMCNPAFERLFGYRVRDVLGARIETLVEPAGNRGELEELIHRAIAGETGRSEIQQRRSDGSRVTVRVMSVPLILHGRNIGAVAMYEDITERRGAEEAHRLAEEKFRNLFENAVDGIFQATPQGTYISVNPALARMCGYSSPAEMIEMVQDIAQQVYADPRRREDFKRQLAEHGVVEGFEIEGRRKDGSTMWVRVSARAVRDDAGKIVSYEGTVEDIAERKRAEEQLRASEARLRVLIEQLPAVLWTVSKDLRFTSALGAGLARLGLKPDQIAGMSLEEYFETLDPEFLPIAAQRRAVAGEPVTFHMEWKGGAYACHAEPLRDASGEVQGAICTALDVTDRKQLEEQFRQSQKMEAVGRLAGGIAHDFNNLLMVIQGYSDLLAERLLAGDPLRRNAEQIQMAAQRATSLTQQLLAFSRKQMVAPKVLNIQSAIADMEKILRRLIGEDISLSSSSARDLWLVKADRGQIEQVILNLAVNARDAMPAGGRLTIETANVELDASSARALAILTPGKYVMLSVTDSGCGMDTETQAHIFEPFFTTKEKGKGTGLGLATVYGIVKQTGGYIWVYSEPGHGTTFKIYLPRIDEEVAVGADRIGSRELPRGSEVILLVEDERGVRELARQYLETVGYTVIEAEDGHTALELASMHAGPIHLLMTDVVMPGINGGELAERVARIRPGVKVLYMSGYTDQTIAREGIGEHGAMLLQKPFSLATLASKLREILAVQAVR